MGLKEEFEELAVKSKTLTTIPTNEDSLILYGLYKQATVGPVNIARPETSDMTEKAKWDAWKAVEEKPTEEAMRDYVTKVRQLIEKAVSASFI